MKINIKSYGSMNVVLNHVILLCIVLSTLYIHKELSTLRTDIKSSTTIPKIKITDVEQFNTMCNQFTEQWGGEHFAFYILQPNSTFKTHKEKSLSSMEVKGLLPNRTPISETSIVDVVGDEGYAKLSQKDLCTVLPGNQLSDTLKTLIIPIYQHEVQLGELYIFYHNEDNMQSLNAQVSEAQLLTRLLY